MTGAERQRLGRLSRLFNRAQGVTFTHRAVDEFRPRGVFFDDLLNEGER